MTEKIIRINDLELWTESFGNKENPAIILISGLGSPGVSWPKEFCETLVQEGYFVIRFDHRDTGFSSSLDFATSPYTLLDMAKDVTHILDHYHIQRAHVAGASMGGLIAMLLGAHFPERVRSLTLMITTVDMRPSIDALMGIENKHALPGPHERVLLAAKETIRSLPVTLEDKIELFVQNSKINSGSIPVDEALCREIALQVCERMKNPASVNNHFRAVMSSHELYLQAPAKVAARTHVIHGDEDPIFPLEHGKAVHAAIKDSTFYVIQGLGHSFANRQFLQPVIRNIVECARTADM